MSAFLKLCRGSTISSSMKWATSAREISFAFSGIPLAPFTGQGTRAAVMAKDNETKTRQIVIFQLVIVNSLTPTYKLPGLGRLSPRSCEASVSNEGALLQVVLCGAVKDQRSNVLWHSRFRPISLGEDDPQFIFRRLASNQGRDCRGQFAHR